MCLYSRLIKNRKYQPNKKNGGIAPICLDKRVEYVPIKCGRCIECRKQKKREWIVRLSEEIRTNNNAYFVTLTFNDSSIKEIKSKLLIKENESYEELNLIATYAVRHWLELIRKHKKKSIKHWLITELGEDFSRIHLHGIVWGNLSDIEKWKYGYWYVGDYVNEKTINYITKYMLKVPEKHPNFIGKILASKGIGSNYMKRNDAENNKYNGKSTNESYRLQNGTKINLPAYYRNKIYTEDEREKLWINKIEQGYRYIMGEKVSTENIEEWENLIKYYQERAKQLYNENPIDWDLEKEKNKRIRLHKWLIKQRKLLIKQKKQ